MSLSANTFGNFFKLTSFGESHGVAIGGVVDGCPPGLSLDENDIQQELDRRKPGTSKFVTQRKEDDKVEILSGVFNGKTTGTPIGFIIKNTDQRSKDYSNIAEIFRPGHADFTYAHKYGNEVRDYRGGGRASARETAVRVAGGAIAKKWLLENYQIKIIAWINSIGTIKIINDDANSKQQLIENVAKIDNKNLFFLPMPFAENAEKNIENLVENYLDGIRKQCNSVGANLSVAAFGVDNHKLPIGLGSPVFAKLDAVIAAAMMSINAVKGVEIGDGYLSSQQLGSEHNDEISPDGFLSNHSGGILGGLSSGQTIWANLAVKPTPSIAMMRRSINIRNEAVEMRTTGRHDPCVGIRAVPVAEAMLALTLADAIMQDKAQCK